MSVEVTVALRCDVRRTAACHRTRTSTYTSPRSLEYLGWDVYREGWVRGYRPPPGYVGPPEACPPEDFVPYDVCPACWRLTPSPEREERGDA
jgi:hypothetical protein